MGNYLQKYFCCNITGLPLLTPGINGTISSISGALIEFSFRSFLRLDRFIFSPEGILSQWYKHLMLGGMLESYVITNELIVPK